MVSFASAWSFDNIKDSRFTTFDGKQVEDYPLLKKYNPIKITNAFGFGDTIFEGYLSQHTETCGIDCSSTIEIKLHEKRPLIEDIEFKELQSKGKWVTQNLDYEFYVDGKKYEVGTSMDAGTYTVRLEASKSQFKTIDWIISTGGETLVEWAVWNSSSATFLQNVSVITHNNNPNDIFFKDDGLRMYVPGTAALISEYSLSKAWNVSTATYTRSVSTTSEESEPEGVFIGKSGTKMYVSGSGGNGEINEYDLTDAWNVSSASANQVLDVQANISLPTGIFLKPDGTRMYITENSGSFINEYFLDVAWDISTARFIRLLDISAKQIDAQGAFLKPDGLKLYTIGINTPTVHEYSLSSAWNVSSGSYLRSITVSTNADTPSGVSFKNDGSMMYVSSEARDAIVQYNLTYTETTLNSPIDKYYSPTNNIEFNCSSQAAVETIKNMSVWTNETGTWALRNITIGLSEAEETQTWTRTFSEGDYILWSCQACESNDICSFAPENRTLIIDTIFPIINLQSPEGLLNYGVVGQSETLNVTFIDTNLDSCWYDYNGTNITIEGCVSGVKNSTTFTLKEDNTNITIYANDTSGNLNITNYNWSYKAIQQNITFNPETFETAEEIFILELIAPEETLTNAKLIYNEIEYPTTIIDKGDNEYNITSTIQIPVTVGNMGFYFNFDTDGDILNSTINHQFVKGWLFNFDESHQVINVTIRDEEDDSIINSTELYISSDYYISDGTIYKTLSNTSTEDGIFNIGINNSNISSFFADTLLRYESAGYKSRDYSASLTLSNSSIADVNLYLLLTANGVTQYFKTYVSTTYAIAPEVSILAYRIEGATEYFADSIVTDSNGEGFLFLDDDEEYKLYISKEGCVSFTKTISPTGITVQNIEIDCGAEEGVVYDNESLIIYENLSVIFSPQNPQIQTGVKEFEVDINDDSCTITSINYYLKKNGVTINSTSSSNACGEDLTLLYNVTENGTMQSYVVIVRNETELIYQKTYYILDTSELIVEGETLWDMLDKLEDITDLGMSQNTKVFLSFIILFLILGFLSMSGIGRSEGIGIFIVIWAYILIMSSIGWLEVNFTTFEYLNKFAILLVVTLIGATIMLIKTEN